MVFGFKEILAQLVAGYIQEGLFAGREEVLTYAAAYIKPMVVRDILLVFAPDFLFSLVYHFALLFVQVVFLCVVEYV